MAKRIEREIWVFGDLRSERLFRSSLNVLAMAREFSRTVKGNVAVLLMGSTVDQNTGGSGDEMGPIPIDAAAEKCIGSGADFVYIVDDAMLAPPRADVYAVPLAEAVQKKGPMLVLFAVTDFGRELAARTARINQCGLIAECLNLRMEEDRVVARCPSWGGEVMADITFAGDSGTGLATVQHHAFQSVELRGEPGHVEKIPVDRIDMPNGLKLLSSTADSEEKQSLEEADVVVVGGAGLGDPEGFGLVRDLAGALGGEAGATRPPVLQHWVEEERMIGQTGKSVRPNLLISVGTSGAVQYTAGITRSKTILAINRDKNAPIFQVADIGVVADAKSFLPLLTSKVKRAAMRNLADSLHDSDKVDTPKAFGAKVRKLRETHDLSLEALAKATGESPEFVEKVEKEEITPPVSFLLRFANALKVNPGTFLSREEETVIRDQRAREFIKRTQNYSYRTLSPGAETDHLRAFMISIEPKQAHKPVAYKHEGEEFIFVMEGALKLSLGNKTHDLKAGESIHFNSHTPHKLKSMSNELTQCLVVLFTP